MAMLIYGMLCSLDGFVADAQGNFDWAAPDEEVHRFVNERERLIGTFLYGRRMYDVMRFWETAHTEPDANDVTREYARIWQAADKVVYSHTLERVETARTRLERRFDPAGVRRLKDEARANLAISGPHLAAEALRAGLVDELHLYLAPIVIGAGNPMLPDDVRVPLTLLDERRFGNGMVYLRYRVT